MCVCAPMCVGVCVHTCVFLCVCVYVSVGLCRSKEEELEDMLPQIEEALREEIEQRFQTQKVEEVSAMGE